MKVLDIDGLNYYDWKIKQTYATKSYVDTQDALKAPLASPALTGNPTAPTQAKTNNSIRLATTAFVKNNLNDYATLNGATFTGAVNGVTPTAGDNSTKLATTAYVQEELRQHANMPIGHEYFTMNPNVPQGSLPLFGGEYSRSTYADLWAWVQTQTGYCKTEAEWQTLSTSNNGNVPFYSSGDGSTTFRVPSLKCWIKGANGTVSEVGSYLAAGLPDITGSVKGATLLSNTEQTGPFGWYSDDPTNYAMTYQNGSMRYGEIFFNASNSNSIYGNSSTVQPESIVGMWLVKAYGTIVDTGTIDEQQYIDEKFTQAKQYTDIRVPTGCVQAFAGNTLPDGWLACDGSAVSRTTYAALFAVIGTLYGSGNGSTTFNLPNLVDRFVEGGATNNIGRRMLPGIPNIYGTINGTVASSATTNVGSLQFSYTDTNNYALTYQSGSMKYGNLIVDGTQSSSIYRSDYGTVQPDSVKMRYIIKY